MGIARKEGKCSSPYQDFLADILFYDVYSNFVCNFYHHRGWGGLSVQSSLL